MNPDVYGRTIEFSTSDNTDIYHVVENDSTHFTVTLPSGTPLSKAYEIIESMAQVGYVPPEPEPLPETEEEQP